jgi:hypothetical protein
MGVLFRQRALAHAMLLSGRMEREQTETESAGSTEELDHAALVQVAGGKCSIWTMAAGAIVGKSTTDSLLGAGVGAYAACKLFPKRDDKKRAGR